MPSDKGSSERGKQAKPKHSPYKRVGEKNMTHTGYVSMSKLAVDKAYEMKDLSSTNHPKFGAGQLATIVKSNERWKVQLPTKYLKDLDEETIGILQRDCMSYDNNPYLVFRGVMTDGSFKMDIYPHGAEIERLYNSGEDVPVDFVFEMDEDSEKDVSEKDASDVS